MLYYIIVVKIIFVINPLDKCTVIKERNSDNKCERNSDNKCIEAASLPGLRIIYVLPRWLNLLAIIIHILILDTRLANILRNGKRTLPH